MTNANKLAAALLRSSSTSASVGAVFTADEVFRWFTERSLQKLNTSEVDVVVAVLTTAEAEGRSVYETARRLEPILLHAAYQWPALLHWRARFTDATTRPVWLPLFDPRHGAQNRRGEIAFFVQSAYMARAGARELASLLRGQELVSGLEAQVLGPGPNDPCAICRPHAGQRFDPRTLPEGGIPPFQPGCRCCLVP